MPARFAELGDLHAGIDDAVFDSTNFSSGPTVTSATARSAPRTRTPDGPPQGLGEALARQPLPCHLVGILPVTVDLLVESNQILSGQRSLHRIQGRRGGRIA